jgi:hypothetical protein
MSIVNILKNTGLSAAICVAINLAIFYISKSQGWISDDFLVNSPTGPKPVDALSVIFVSAVSCLVGGVLYWVLSNYVPKGTIIFWLIALVYLFYSYFNPAKYITNCPVSMEIALNVMHNVVASTLLFFLTGRKENAFV